MDDRDVFDNAGKKGGDVYNILFNPDTPQVPASSRPARPEQADDHSSIGGDENTIAAHFIHASDCPFLNPCQKLLGLDYVPPPCYGGGTCHKS